MNTQEKLVELDKVLCECLDLASLDLNRRAKIEEFPSGVKFEQIVCDSLNKFLRPGIFKSLFILGSTYSFPDIYIQASDNQNFGIEVKTSKSSWRCFGNSIFESTRISGLDDRIFVFFAKFEPDLECRWKRYEESIDTINITHSPRFQINMEIDGENQKSVFNKMQTTYESFWASEVKQKMSLVRRLKKDELGPDAAVWWLSGKVEDDQSADENLRINLLGELNQELRNQIFVEALVFFPEIFGVSRHKYNRVMKWLASDYGVVSKSLRDGFSAGGKYDLDYLGKAYRIPRVFEKVYSLREEIKALLEGLSLKEVSNYWIDLPIVRTLGNDPKERWIILVSYNSKIEDDFPTSQWLEEILS